METSNPNLNGMTFLGWSCGRKPRQEDLEAALTHFVKKYGRRPALVALREPDGLTPPPDVMLLAWDRVPPGCLYLALGGSFSE